MAGKENPFQMLLQKMKQKPKLWIAACIIMLAVVVFGGAAFFYVSALKPAEPGNHKTKLVTIPPGSGVTEIGHILQKNGIIQNAWAFAIYAKSHRQSGLKAGTYQMSPSMDTSTIVRSMQKGGIAAIRFTVPEGAGLEEIAEIIQKHSSFRKEEVLKRADDPAFVQHLMKKYPRLVTKEVFNQQIRHPLEGYFFPATYSFYDRHVSLDAVLETMVAKTNAVFSAYAGQSTQARLTPHKLLTMASLIEAEATKKADRAKISSVFYNRLKKNMPLQTDPTVLYALNRHKEKVTYKDLRVNSPYNTYKHKGLPPGPIASPGEQSIKAALKPEKTDYLYFLANVDTGKVYFANTLKEHNALKEKYIAKAKR